MKEAQILIENWRMEYNLSYGIVNQRDADFWGWAVEFSRRIRGPWSGAVAIMWDRETEKLIAALEERTDTFTASATIAYALTDRISLTTGLGKGFADTDNPSQSMQFANGDLSTGIILGYSTPGLLQFTQDAVALS